jgi:hypothetical protein
MKTKPRKLVEELEAAASLLQGMEPTFFTVAASAFGRRVSYARRKGIQIWQPRR